MLRRMLCMAAIGLLAVPALAQAQTGPTWPTRPVRMIVPFPPGGTTDIIARLMQQPLAERLGQPVVVENRAGAAGTAGMEQAVRSNDGHTFSIAISSLASNVALQPSLPFDVMRDITPLTLVGYVPNLIAVHPSVRATTLAELVALAKASPGALNYATSGVGTANHFAGELFRLEAGIDIVHTPYRGGGPAINDLVGGQVPIGVNALASVLPHLRSQRVRPLATTGLKRSPVTPDVPTVAEQGFPGFEVVEWWGFVAPASMSADAVARLNKELVAILTSPAMAEKLSAQGVEIATTTPAEFKALLARDVAKFAGIVARSGIKAE